MAHIFSRVCLSVCVSVCLWPALLPFNVDRFWRNLVTRTLLWSSLAATIMVQIGRRGTARRLFENLKKNSQKSQNIRISKFWSIIFASMSPVYCKKSTRFELTEEIHFEVCHSGNLPPIVACSGSTGGVAACNASRRQRCVNPEMLRPHHSADSDHRSANWGHSALGAQLGRKNQPACFCILYITARCSFYCSISLWRINVFVNLY